MVGSAGQARAHTQLGCPVASPTQPWWAWAACDMHTWGNANLLLAGGRAAWAGTTCATLHCRLAGVHPCGARNADIPCSRRAGSSRDRPRPCSHRPRMPVQDPEGPPPSGHHSPLPERCSASPLSPSSGLEGTPDEEVKGWLEVHQISTKAL